MTEPTTTRTADAILSKVRACARLRVAWMEQLWGEGETSPDQGLAISAGEVRRILDGPERAAERFGEFLLGYEPARLLREAQAAEESLGQASFWTGLRELFRLSQAELDLLALCVAVEMDARLGRVLAYLADDTRATRPSQAISADLSGSRERGPESMDGLLRWRLAQPLRGEHALLCSTEWRADPAVVLSVLAERWHDPALKDAVRTIEVEEAGGRPCLYPHLLKKMLDEVSQEVLVRGGEGAVVLMGPKGSGRETLASQYAAGIGRPLISVNRGLLGNSVTSAAEKTHELVSAVRLAFATGAVLYWRDADELTADDDLELKRLRFQGLRGAHKLPAGAAYSYALKPLPMEQRLAAWHYWSGEPVPGMVRTQRLTPDEIRLVSQASPQEPVYASLRRTVEAQSDLMQRLECPYEWSDLVVAPELLRTLKDFEAQVLLRWEVYEEWEFARLTHLGQGISALFGGPSGTGKTMAAQVLARSLGMELYRVDLAGVVNKYIGETEKRLRTVFDTCERSGALLFFDEADALFGSRTQVKDAHDRYANIAIDYLLQRIEQFDGIAILATNRKNDLDPSFLRRLRFVVDFLPPDKAERRLLWEKSLPAYTNGGERITEELDFDRLAREMEMNGAQIKATALGAAFLARSAGTRIGMEQIETSALREFAKQGQLMRSSLSGAAAL